LKLVREYGGLKGVIEHLREKYVFCLTLPSLLMPRIDKRRKRRARPRRTMGRRKGEVFKYPQSGHGKRRKRFLSSRT
jgi:hypothetical protein